MNDFFRQILVLVAVILGTSGMKPKLTSFLVTSKSKFRDSSSYTFIDLT